MKQLKAFIKTRWCPACGAALAVLGGLLLWGTPVGEPWVNASYDFLFRFGARGLTNQVVLIQLDTESYDSFHQLRGQPWDRALHARLLDKLADDGCALTVFDVFFRAPGDPSKDAALAEALRRQRRVILMADHAALVSPQLASARPILPFEILLNAAGTNWGVAWLDPDLDAIVRRHWPFPAPGPYESLPQAAARLMGVSAISYNQASAERWLRYYGESGSATALSYKLALTQATNYFRNKLVFIGNQPKTTVPDAEPDKFSVPHTRWTGEAVGGTAILATEFLNLLNGDWLRRPAAGYELLLLVVTGVLLGGGFCRLRFIPAALAVVVVVVVVTLGFVSWSYHTNFWFPWLVIVGGQLPCALAWAWLAPKPQKQTLWTEAQGKFPGYTIVGKPFGEGGYGRVWLVRNATGQLQALKEIERAKFTSEEPYDREFHGIKNYKPVSLRHPGLLHIDHVNRNDQQGYFYYVMELGDSLDPDWQILGKPYRPRDLASVCGQREGRRLPATDCIRKGAVLLEALEYLHDLGLVHGDIKPSNIIFVSGRPKLADVGLVRLFSDDIIQIGTEFFLPPESPGTLQADLYALGKVLYVISTGNHPRHFPDLPEELVVQAGFMRLNRVICRACPPAGTKGFASAAEMRAALLAARQEPETALME